MIDKFMLKVGEYIALKRDNIWSEYRIEKITTIETHLGHDTYVEAKNDYHRITIDLVEYLEKDAIKSLAYD